MGNGCCPLFPSNVDFLSFGDSSKMGLKTVFRELCEIPVEDDGLTLIVDSIQVDAIRDDTEYGGMRVKLVGELASAKIPIQADIGFGDAVTPDPRNIEYPTLLGSPAPFLKAYPREAFILPNVANVTRTNIEIFA